MTARSLLCAMLLLLPGAGHTQTPTIRTHTSIVLVPALVRSKGGDLVYTLTAKDFTLTDDGIPQKLTLEEDNGGQPLALVVAIETGGAGARQLDKYARLGTMIETVVGNVPHRIAIVDFDTEPELLQDFTSNADTMQKALQQLEPGNGGAAILDGLTFSVDLLRKQPPQYRRAILLLSETLDHGSRVKLPDALRAISDTNTAIYSVAFSSAKSGLGGEAAKFNRSEPGPPGGCMSKDPDALPDPTDTRFKQAWDCLSMLAPPLRLAKMAAMLAMDGMHRNVAESVAQLTGGEFYTFNNSRSLERDLATISNHVPNRYVLSFHPQLPHPGPHAVELHLPDYPGLKISARSTYWAGTATAPPANQ